MVGLSQPTVGLGVCVLLSVLVKVRTRHVPTSEDNAYSRLKTAGAVKRSFRIAVRSLLDNRIDAIPRTPEFNPYHYQQVGPVFPPSHLPDIFQSGSRFTKTHPRHQHPEDFFKHNRRPIQPPQQFERSEFDMYPMKNSRPRPTKQHDFPDLEDLLNRSVFLSKDLVLPSRPVLPPGTAVSRESEGSTEGVTTEIGGFQPLDPNFLSGLDFDTIPRGDGLFDGDSFTGLSDSGQLDIGGIPELAVVDNVADNIMDDFLTFLDLRASGALDKCLNKDTLQTALGTEQSKPVE